MKLKQLFEMTINTAEKVLGVAGTNYDASKLKKAYRALSAKNHPDKGGSNAKMKEINVAYDTLKNETGSTNSKDDKTLNIDEFTNLLTNNTYRMQMGPPFPNIRYISADGSLNFIQFTFSKKGNMSYVQLNGKGLFELDGGLRLKNFSKHKAAFNKVILPTTLANTKMIANTLSKVTTLAKYEKALGKILNSTKL